MTRVCLALLMALTVITSAAGAADEGAAPAPHEWKEGTDYDRIAPPQPVSAGRNKIEVIEFFGYWCPHCRDLEPLFVKWSAAVPADVVVVRIPVVWDQRQTHNYARLFYTLQSLGRLDLHSAFFKAVEASEHAGHGKLGRPEDQQAFAEQNGIPAQTFAQIYHSDTVREKVEQAARAALAYKVDATPTLIVQGAYRAKSTGEFAERLQILDWLIQRARSEEKSTASAHRPRNGVARFAAYNSATR